MLADLFEHFFLADHLKGVILNQINKNIEGLVVSRGEFLQWVGCWFQIATITKLQCYKYWKNSEVNTFSRAPFWLTPFMSGNRFKAILYAIEYSNNNPPTYKD